MSTKIAPPSKTLTASLRNVAKFIDSKPHTWSEENKDDKVLFVMGSYALIDLLSTKQFEEYRKKEYIGDAIFLWLKYLANRREFQESPETVKLSRFQHPVFQSVPINVPLLSGKTYVPGSSVDKASDQPTSASTVKQPNAKPSNPQPSNKSGHDQARARSSTSDIDRHPVAPVQAKAEGAKRTKGGSGKGKQPAHSEAGDDSAMEVDEEESNPSGKGGQKARRGVEDEGPSWNSKDDSDASYHESDSDEDTDSGNAKAIRKTNAKTKSAATKSSSAAGKRGRAEDDTTSTAAKKVKSNYYKAPVPCTTCQSKGQDCFISRPRVACIGCNPPGKKRLATCSFSSRKKKSPHDDGARDEPSVAEDTSTVNGDDLDELAPEVPNSASAIQAKHPPRQSGSHQLASRFNFASAERVDTSQPPALEALVESGFAKHGRARAKPTELGEGKRNIAKSTSSTQADFASAKSTSSVDQAQTMLTRVAPAAAVELSSSSIDRTVTRLLMENARQQASINYLMATMEVLLEETKEYEQVLAYAATQEARIKTLEEQLEAAQESVKQIHDDRESDAKALGAENTVNTRRIESLASTLTVINNWVASKIKAELGTVVATPRDTEIQGVQIPMPLDINPPSNPANVTTAQDTSDRPLPTASTIVSGPSVEAKPRQEPEGQGGILDYIQYPPEEQVTGIHSLQENEEVERLMREE
ncbi:hypothetical protein CC2G_003471 [Coprinopsis cinerea AmutBmut pab1-1]|nr:hypothetical protein CC2G_003471 [Coprinopsis cinerea AmutBmut pab1-1]